MEELLHANATFSYVDGDKTVPSESATADGLEATERVGIKADHRCGGADRNKCAMLFAAAVASVSWEGAAEWLRRLHGAFLARVGSGLVLLL